MYHDDVAVVILMGLVDQPTAVGCRVDITDVVVVQSVTVAAVHDDCRFGADAHLDVVRDLFVPFRRDRDLTLDRQIARLVVARCHEGVAVHGTGPFVCNVPHQVASLILDRTALIEDAQS